MLKYKISKISLRDCPALIILRIPVWEWQRKMKRKRQSFSLHQDQDQESQDVTFTKDKCCLCFNTITAKKDVSFPFKFAGTFTCPTFKLDFKSQSKYSTQHFTFKGF